MTQAPLDGFLFGSSDGTPLLLPTATISSSVRPCQLGALGRCPDFLLPKLSLTSQPARRPRRKNLKRAPGSGGRPKPRHALGKQLAGRPRRVPKQSGLKSRPLGPFQEDGSLPKPCLPGYCWEEAACKINTHGPTLVENGSEAFRA